MHERAAGGMSPNDAPAVALKLDESTGSEGTAAAPQAFSTESFSNRFALPGQQCAHCLGHSGPGNLPLSFVAPTDHRRGGAFGPLPAARVTTRPPTLIAQHRLPGAHAPPGSTARRHLLTGVFLI
jgi:hypothetical protein